MTQSKEEVSLKKVLLAKLKDMPDAKVQEIWKELGNTNLSDDDWYDEPKSVTMLDWAEEIFIELSRRGFPTIRRDGER